MKKAIKVWVVVEEFDNKLIENYNTDKAMADSLGIAFNEDEISRDIEESSILSIQKGIIVLSDISSVKQSYLLDRKIKPICIPIIKEAFSKKKDFKFDTIPVLHICTKGGDYFTTLGIIEIMFPYFKFSTDAKT